ncbi:MAG: hypothetical protein CUN52_07955 [Phototrophicales bacterium]|nr:MAG: hypothetical protein CUN52_07955 [Phototrophicales bacterium]
MPILTRRQMLMMLVGTPAALIPKKGFIPPNPERIAQLQARINSLFMGENIGFDLRGWDNITQTEIFRIAVNGDAYYPVASSFKTLVVLYYFWYTPRELWRDDPESDAYRVAVFSNNLLTGTLLQNTAQYVGGFGNAIQKFNIFLTYTLKLDSGIFSWDWQGSPTMGQRDLYYEPTEQRSVIYNGQRYDITNLFSPRDLSQTYLYLLKPTSFPQYPQAYEALLRTRALFSIPASGYQSPIERAFGRYTGKDGVIPTEDARFGRVTNDAGIVRPLLNEYVISIMYAQGEFRLVAFLRQIRRYLIEYEVG